MKIPARAWSVAAVAVVTAAAMAAPAARGRIEQTAQRVARDLASQGYEVEPGYPMLWTQADCDRYSFPAMGNCYGNNPASPYVVTVVKPWPDEFVDPATVNALGKTRQGYSATYRLDPREAIVVFAELPPPGRYMGLQSYVFTKEWLTESHPWNPDVFGMVQARAPRLVDYLFATVPGNPSRIQSFSSLSNSINDVVIREQSGRAFGQGRYFIITPDRAMDRAVRSSLELLGVRDEDVFTEPIPLRDQAGEIGQIGLDAKANDFLTILRYAMPDDEHAAHAWWANLPLTILRVRESPSVVRPAEPFPPFVADGRSAVREDIYRNDLHDLARHVCERWGQPCEPEAPDSDSLRRLIDMQQDLHLSGTQCRALGMNCLGDSQDTSYFIAPGRPLDPGWVYAVVGTLGTVTGNATYVGLSVNDVTKLEGVVNIPDTKLAGSAASYAGAVDNTDKFFVHYFTRDCGAIDGLTDGQCTSLTEDLVPPLGEGLQGLFACAVRSYVRPGTARAADTRIQLRPMIMRFVEP